MSQSGPIIGSWKRNVPMLLLAVAWICGVYSPTHRNPVDLEAIEVTTLHAQAGQPIPGAKTW